MNFNSKVRLLDLFIFSKFFGFKEFFFYGSGFKLDCF